MNIDYYTDRELTLGAVLNVFGRKFLICDCDEFTKEYYRTKYGICKCHLSRDYKWMKSWLQVIF